MKKNIDGNYLTKIGVFSSALFVAASAVYIYSPVLSSNADDNLYTQVSAVVNPVLSLSLDVDELTFNISPTAEGTFDSEPIVATSKTNSTGGYELYFSSIDESTDMVHDNPAVSDVIASDFSGTVTNSTMPANKWGYSTDGTEFSAIPTSSSQAQLRNIDHYPDSEERDASVYIGTKISSALKSGSYSKDLIFSAVAHDTAVAPTFHTANYMQDMTPGVCFTATTPKSTATAYDWDGSHHGDRNYVPRTKLIDARDGKTYIISKLADGNCWMSQNLALELTEDEEVVIANIDGTTGTATPDNTTQTERLISWEKTGDTWRSYHPEDDVAYYQDGVTQSSEPTDTGDAYVWEYAGNYYNWYAATGGTGTESMASGNATASICAKGWRLPTSEGSKSLYNLFANGYKLELLTEEAGTALRAAPLNFVLAGGYNWLNGKLDHAEENGFYWMSTAYDGTNAYRMSSKTTYIKPQGNYHKGYGFPIRCVSI